MEVRIRLQKAGTKATKRYNYRVVAISRTTSRQGKHLDMLGYYDPAKKPHSLNINQEKLAFWLKRGARMSDTVQSLVNQTKKQASK